MTDQSETSTANNTVERQLCKMGCGFFVSYAVTTDRHSHTAPARMFSSVVYFFRNRGNH